MSPKQKKIALIFRKKHSFSFNYKVLYIKDDYIEENKLKPVFGNNYFLSVKINPYIVNVYK